MWGQSLSEQGMVIDTTRLEAATPLVFADDAVTAPASINMRELQRQLRRRGVRLPVYTTAPHATLGGTLAAGGISGRSFRNGLLAGSVLQAEVMGSDGRSWRCSADENPDLFPFSAATLGHTGPLLSAKLKTQRLLPERSQLIVPRLACEQLTDHLAEALAAIPEVVALEGFVNLRSDHPTMDVHATMEAMDATDRGRKASQWADLQQRLQVPNAFVRNFNIDDAIIFSESLGGWGATTYDLELKAINSALTRYVIPVSVVVALAAAPAFLARLQAYVASHAGFFLDKAYFTTMDASPEAPIAWARLAQTKSYFLGMDVLVAFGKRQLAEAVSTMNVVLNLLETAGGRLYPYAFLPDKSMLSKLVLPYLPGLPRAVSKLDPEGLIRRLF